jgi:hypothetical protein
MGRDRASRTIVIFMVLGLVIAPTIKAEPVWGTAHNGLALGVDVGATLGGEVRVRVHFRNERRTPLEFAVGGASGGGSMYSVDLSSIGPDRKSCKLLDTTVGVVAGHVSPIVIRLKPGETDYIAIDPRKLICMVGRSTTTFDTLLMRGHSVRAIFGTDLENNAWARIPNGWTGKTTSGVFQRNTTRQGRRLDPSGLKQETKVGANAPTVVR